MNAICLFVGRISIKICAALANSGFSFFVGARGCTRITLNVTRLSGAHAASKLSPYIIVLCVRVCAPSFLSGERRSEINVVQRSVTQHAVVFAKLYFIYIAATHSPALRCVNRIMNKYLLHYVDRVTSTLNSFKNNPEIVNINLSL